LKLWCAHWRAQDDAQKDAWTVLPRVAQAYLFQGVLLFLKTTLARVILRTDRGRRFPPDPKQAHRVNRATHPIQNEPIPGLLATRTHVRLLRLVPNALALTARGKTSPVAENCSTRQALEDLYWAEVDYLSTLTDRLLSVSGRNHPEFIKTLHECQNARRAVTNCLEAIHEHRDRHGC
jgi:hypothetical protein